MRIGYAATGEVRAAINAIGRTEDVHVSPDGGRIALLGMVERRILIIDVALEEDPAGLRPALTAVVALASPALSCPHGLFWIDAATLAVADRSGAVLIFALPPSRPPGGRLSLAPLRRIELADQVVTPGSLSVSPIGLGLVDLLVCNNYAHRVSRHLLDGRDDYAVLASEVLLDEGLAVPDGVAHSPSGRWIAVSNHDRHAVFLYRNRGELNPASAPDGILRGVAFPHGLRFSPDESELLVADAGSPFLYLYACADGGWDGERMPARAIRTLTDRAYRRGADNRAEGGTKGVALLPGAGLVVTTCGAQPLGFFRLGGRMGEAPRPAPAAADEAERAREAMVTHLLAARLGVQQTTENVRRAVAHVHASRYWRLTAPLRRAVALWRRWRDRGRYRIGRWADGASAGPIAPPPRSPARAGSPPAR